MTLFYATHNSAHVNPSWPYTTISNIELDNQTDSTTEPNSLLVSIPASGLKSAGFITKSTLPNNDNWESGGTWEQEIEITIAIMDIRGRCRAVMLNSTGSILQSGTFSDYQTFQTLSFRTFNFSAPTWTASQACTNLFAIEWEFENLNTMFTKETEIRYRSVSSPQLYEILTDLSINTASCTGGSTFIPKIIVC
jgi:hypothetical protein